MRHLESLGLCLAAALLPAGIVMPASASAASFIVKKQGTGLVISKNVGSQAFIIPGEGSVTCESTGMGKAEATLGKPSLFQLVSLVYKGCLFMNSIEAFVSESMLDFNANGFVRVVEREEEEQAAKPIVIDIVGCEITIGEANNTTLSTVEYKNLAKGEVEVFAKLTGVTAHEGAFPCPSPNTTIKTAEFRGRSVVKEEGGEIEVK